jgi:hypothetical protein
MKCDEVKPTCGPCAKKDKTCDYVNSNRHSVDPRATNRAVPETLPVVSTAQQTPPPEQSNDRASSGPNPNPVHYEPHGTSDHAWTASETDANPPPPALLEYRSENELILSRSPEALHGDYLSPSTASLAAVRWFGLLSGGFPSDGPQLSAIPNAWEDQSLSLGHASDDDPAQASSLQRATQVLDSPPGSAASHDVTDGRATESSTLTEEQIWQSREPIELLATEQALFEHFVHQVSPWVGRRCYIRDWCTLT